MRSQVLVLTIAFVFLSTAVLIHPVAGQSGSTGYLTGMVCAETPGGYPKPYSGPSANGTSGASCQYSQGIPGATIYLTRTVAGVALVNKSASSDDSGAYAIKDVATGDYTVTVVRAGFNTDSAAMTIAAGGNRHAVALAGKDITVTGTVSRVSDGQGLSGAELTLCCPPDGTQGSAVSGSDGHFSVKGKGGWQGLSAHRSGYQDWNVYQLFDGAKPVSVTMDAIPPQDSTLHGVVRDQHGSPVSGADVYVSSNGNCCYAYDTAGTSSGTTTSGYSTSSGMATASPAMRPYYGGQNHTMTDAQGRYSMHVYSGDNYLSVSKEGYAGISLNVHVDQNSDTTQDLKLQKYPAKTAHIEGRVTDANTGKGVRFVQVNVQSPEFGISECSIDADQAKSNSMSGQPQPDSGGGSAGMGIAYPYPGPYSPGCVIVVQSDGRFAGDVTPGYSIVSVVYESWRSCSETHNADGSSSSVCGPEYNSWTRSLVLTENATTKVDAALKPRPAADAVVSGYLIDSESGNAITGAQISFSNEDTQGYGSATTDGDGSYKLKLRSGYHQVYAYADGHLRWQGVLDVKSGDTAFDVQLTPGTESNGGCCYGGPYPMMAKGMAGMTYSSTASYAPPAGGAGGAPAPMGGMQAAGDSTGGGQVAQYEDLGGGLGPYKASERGGALANSGKTSSGHGAAALGLLPMLAALGAVLAVAAIRRRL